MFPGAAAFIEAGGEGGEVAGGDGGVEVVFGVEEHAVGEEGDPAAALGAGGEGFVFAVVVNGPDREEAGETFTDEHYAEVKREAGQQGGKE